MASWSSSFFCPWCHVARGHDPVFSGAGRMGIVLFLFLSFFFFIFDVRNNTVLYGGYLPMGSISFVYTYCSCFVVVRYCGVNRRSWGNATRLISLKLAQEIISPFDYEEYQFDRDDQAV